MLRTSEWSKQRAESRRLGRAIGRRPEDDFSQVVGDPHGHGPLERPGKIVGDFLSVGASGVVIGQRGSEAVEDPHPVNDVKMISPHDAMNDWVQNSFLFD